MMDKMWNATLMVVALVASRANLYNYFNAIPPASELSSDSPAGLVNLTVLEHLVDEGAVCLDGSPPAYYMRRGSSRNWLVFLQGGAWCYGDPEQETSCAKRSTTFLGSSNFMAKQLALDSGIFSSSPENNPDFWNWNRVYINYCDGASFSGDVEEPLAVHTKENQTRLLYYRGQRIWRGVIKDLLANGMKDAEMALLTGCSAGGLATMLHCNQFKELMPRTCAVKCMSDGGFFLDLQDIHGKKTIRSIFKEVVREHHVVIARHYVDKDYKQLFPQYLLPSIQPPFFFVNAAYDTWQIDHVLQYPTPEWKQCVISESCTSTQLEILQGFRKSILRKLKVVYRKEGRGMFIDSCFSHCQNENGLMTHLKVNNQTLMEAVGDWYFERKPIKEVDPPWPSNPTCVTSFFPQF